MFGGLHGLRQLEEIQRGLGLNMSEKTPQEQGRDFISIFETLINRKEEDDLFEVIREEINKIRDANRAEFSDSTYAGKDLEEVRRVPHRLTYDYLTSVRNLIKFIPMFNYNMIMNNRASQIMSMMVEHLVYAGTSSDKEQILVQQGLLLDRIRQWQKTWEEDWEFPNLNDKLDV